MMQPSETAAPRRRNAGLTVEEILLRHPGSRRGQPIAGPRRTVPRRPGAYFPPPPKSVVLAWIRRNPWTTAITAYALWMLGWGLQVWYSNVGLG